MINGFDDFIFESYLAESILCFSPRFRKKLNSISDDNNIAKELLDLEQTDIKSDLTFIDIDEEDFNFLTFIPMKNAESIIKNHWAYDDDHGLEFSITDDIWSNRFDADNKFPRVYTKGRNSIKIGKLVNKISQGKYKNVDVERFVNMMKSTRSDKNETFELVYGKEIPQWYDKDKYFDKSTGNILGNSCMRDLRKDAFKIYEDNPNSVRMLILKLGDKLLGRALIWKLKKVTSKGKEIQYEYFMDRVYVGKDSDYHKFVNYANEKGWLRKGHNGLGSPDWANYKSMELNDVVMTVKVKPIHYEFYPYLDTFGRYNSDLGILYNDTNWKKGGHIINYVNGEYRRSITKSKILKNKIKRFFGFDD